MSPAESKLFNAYQIKADMFDYLAWLDLHERPPGMESADFLCLASDGTTCWGKTYAEAVRVAMEHDRFTMKPVKNPAAVSLGRLGGKAGTGKAKARTKAQCRAAALKRWRKNPERGSGRRETAHRRSV